MYIMACTHIVARAVAHMHSVSLFTVKKPGQGGHTNTVGDSLRQTFSVEVLTMLNDWY